MIVERKPNGDYLAQAEPSDTAPEQRETLLVLLLWALGDSDCSFLGEEYCLKQLGYGRRRLRLLHGQGNLPALLAS